MKISTRIASGYAVLILLLLGVFSYQILLIHRMHSINQDLGGLNFSAATLSLELIRDLDQVEEFTQKLYATGGDPGYAEQVEEMRKGFSQSLERIQGLSLEPEEKEQVEELAQLWRQARAAAAEGALALGGANPAATQEALDRELSLLEDVRMQTQGVFRATRLAIPEQVADSERAARRAQNIFFASVLVALLLSAVVCIWTVRSISRPLRRLTAGTHAIAEGHFDYRIGVSGKDELAALARDFNWMTRRLNELDQMKKDFVSHVSHELKTPLASMQETIRLLLDEIPGSLSTQQRRLLELNLQSSARLSTLIANLLDLSRMEAGVMDYVMEKNDLVALVRNALAEIEVPLGERNLRLEADLPDTPFWLDCDGDRVLQVLHNLLGNALKFSPPGSSVRVTLRQEQEIPSGLPGMWRTRLASSPNAHGYAFLAIADQGPGIPADAKPKIFEKFHQVKRGKQPGQGTGLGLAIARTIVEAHGGLIWVEDNPGGGSLFCILLRAGELVPQETLRASAPI
jgi:two-component system sensor histidine kinase GlrK